LLAGVYDGSLTLEELTRHGNFGIGTFDKLDGEMMMVDNRIYQIKSDGKVYTPALSMTTPYQLLQAIPTSSMLSG
jgi:acetolactate decarboxylase